MINQLLKENEYLRFICNSVIKTEAIISLKKQESIEKSQKKEVDENERNVTESNTYAVDDIDIRSKGLHKRQKTHINILTCNSTTNSIGSTNTEADHNLSKETSRDSIISSADNDKVIILNLFF